MCVGIILFLVQISFAHPFYVSVTEINKNEQKGTLEISIKIFIDDFEHGLKKYGHTKMFIGDDKESPKVDTLIQQYLLKNFSLEVNGKEREYAYLGKQVEDEELFLFIEMRDVETLNTLTIFNYLLCDVYETQSNIIHFKTIEEVKSLLLTKQKPTGTLNFDQE